MSRDKLANELLAEFSKYFAHELLPRLGPHDMATAHHLYQNNPMVRAKADSMVASIMQLVNKHVAFEAPTQPTRECSQSPRGDGDHVWITRTHMDVETGDNIAQVYCKHCGENQQ